MVSTPISQDLSGTKNQILSQTLREVYALIHYNKVDKRCKKISKRAVVAPTHLSLFLNHNHNCPLMLQFYISFIPTMHQLFSLPFFVAKRSFASVMPKFLAIFIVTFSSFGTNLKLLSCSCLVGGLLGNIREKIFCCCSLGFYFIIRMWLRHISLISEDQV